MHCRPTHGVRSRHTAPSLQSLSVSHRERGHPSSVKSEFSPQESGSGCIESHRTGTSQDENEFCSHTTVRPVLEDDIAPELLADVVDELVALALVVASGAVEGPAVVDGAPVEAAAPVVPSEGSAVGPHPVDASASNSSARRRPLKMPFFLTASALYPSLSSTPSALATLRRQRKSPALSLLSSTLAAMAVSYSHAGD